MAATGRPASGVSPAAATMRSGISSRPWCRQPAGREHPSHASSWCHAKTRASTTTGTRSDHRYGPRESRGGRSLRARSPRRGLDPDLAAGTKPGSPDQYQPALSPVVSFSCAGHPDSPVLGMAEDSLAEFIDMVKGRSTRGAVAGGSRKMAKIATIPVPRCRGRRVHRRGASGDVPRSRRSCKP